MGDRYDSPLYSVDGPYSVTAIIDCCDRQIVGFRDVTGRAGIKQEYITPYTPEQNGMIERGFRTPKDECLWKNNFKTIDKAWKNIVRFILEYNTNRTRRSLGMLTTSEWREKLGA